MSRFLGREKDKALNFETIAPEDVRKRARASQSSNLTASLASRSCESKGLAPCRSSSSTSLSSLNRYPVQENPTSLQAAVDHFKEDSREASGEIHEEVLSPGSRPIQRKPRIQKKAEFPQSELGKSLNEDNDFVPPHILSLPAQNFNALELSSRPGSLYEGAGRKLRGMDAVRFRRNVMRQTGFLETAENAVH